MTCHYDFCDDINKLVNKLMYYSYVQSDILVLGRTEYYFSFHSGLSTIDCLYRQSLSAAKLSNYLQSKMGVPELHKRRFEPNQPPPPPRFSGLYPTHSDRLGQGW